MRRVSVLRTHISTRFVLETHACLSSLVVRAAPRRYTCWLDVAFYNVESGSLPLSRSLCEPEPPSDATNVFFWVMR